MEKSVDTSEIKYKVEEGANVPKVLKDHIDVVTLSGALPQRIVCPKCQFNGMTQTKRKKSVAQLVLCCVGCPLALCWVPFCAPSLYKT